MDEEQKGLMGFRIQLSTPVVVFIILQAVFVIFLIITIVQLPKSNKVDYEDVINSPAVSISNYSDALPSDYNGESIGLRTTLFNLILRNSPDRAISGSIDARIREDSIKKVFFEEKNLNFYSAIIDVPEIEQSYWFYSEYSSNDGNQYIDYSKSYRFFCLDDAQEKIYPDFGCKDDFGLVGRYEIVSKLLSFFDFDYFNLSLPTANGAHKIKIKPTNYDIDDVTKESYIQQTRDAVASLGVLPDYFEYYVMGPADIIIYYP